MHHRARHRCRSVQGFITEALEVRTLLSNNLLVNGDFESEPNFADSVPNYGVNGGDPGFSLLVGSQIPGWTVAPGHGVTVHNTTSYLTIGGAFSVNMDGEGYNGVNADLYQDVPTTSGQSYTLNFDWQGWVDTNSTTNLVVTLTDLTTSAVLFNGNYSWNSALSHETASFTGTGNNVRLELSESPQSGNNDNLYVVDNFSITTGGLVFNSIANGTAANGTIDPPVTVTLEDANGNTDTSATGDVTLSLNGFAHSGTGALNGTLSEPFVSGVATFSDLSIDTNGGYQLHATDSAGDAGDSNKFAIGASPLKLEINSRSRGGTNGVKPGYIILYSVLVTPPTSLSVQDQNLVVTLPTGFVPKGITAGGTFSGNTITWTKYTRLYDFDMQVPSAATLNGLKNIVVSGDDNVTYTDDSTDEATASNTVKIAVDNGLEFTTNPGNQAAGQTLNPALMVAVKDIYGDVDTNSTDTVKLFVRNGAGALTGTITQPAAGGVATFDGLSLARAGEYVLGAVDLTTRTIKPGLSDPFAVVGLGAIIATFERQERLSHDNSLTITNTNAIAMSQSSGTLSLEALAISNRTPEVLSGVKWAVVRNTDDVVSSPDPTVTPDGSDPLQATLSLNQAEGSFNLICYYDSNSNGVYDSGEELRVFHLAEVGVVVQPGGSIVPSNASFAGGNINPVSSKVVSGSFSGNHWAITSSETVQVVGGGADGMIGVSKIHVGWLQNGVGDSVVVTYQNGKTRSEQLVAGKFPLLDATFAGFGPDVIFELPLDPTDGTIRDRLIGTDPAGGQDRLVATGDSPNVVFPTLYFRSPAVSTAGTNDFAEYITAFTDDFRDSYTAYFKVNWSVAFNLTLARDSSWQSNGAAVTESESNLGGGKLVSSLDVATTRPLFFDVVKVR